ncbi:hypothetical protein [Dehalococcoides mccartyi]|uniref:hypothetical protein n=1 Tax=Dehalococcoides mccartyi TaxID=61435 RepID=UPI000804DC13|nr:hypothetical protein [Dehalococcoides mccartyi]OBW61984.1 MAG: hypothetical protein A9181_03175 [Dehalococcoides mccartyi]BEL00779.1 hypothetical protein DMOBY_06320 [Dehalococcoides mccartyi]
MPQKDYSASAVNLTNSANLRELLFLRGDICSAIAELECVIRQKCEREYEVLASAKGQLAEVDARIKLTIDSEGSFQDIEKGLYAIKMERKSIKYSPELIEHYCPEYGCAVIERHVNTERLQKLSTAGLIPPDIMQKIIGDIKTTYAFIIDTPSIQSGEKAYAASP